MQEFQQKYLENRRKLAYYFVQEYALILVFFIHPTPALLGWKHMTLVSGLFQSQRINRVFNLWVLTPQIFPYFKSSISPLTIKWNFSHPPLVKKKYYLVTIITVSNKIVCCMFKICLLSRKAPRCNNFPPVRKAGVRVFYLWSDNNQIQKCKVVVIFKWVLGG